MKKLSLIIFIFCLFVLTSNSVEKKLEIPKESIRFRVIANSNSKEDQSTKELVKEAVQEELYNSIKDSEDIEEARRITTTKLPEYRHLVEQALGKTDNKFTIDYGLNYFPEKMYNGIYYPSGRYESLVITLGEGQGDNWWCVLFPPLCLLEATESGNSEDIEYSFFFQEILEKYF
ncbi:MAG TPA: stage II sporulation protein R [Candidatus Scybalousia intestinigallinarum]|nr:stage II sporulation protein R [Candidatus Scybalousia intestinigallinarum]